jgi:ParB family chromosome partitioning protein
MDRRGLGRGLGSLLAESSSGERVQEVPVSQIVPSPYQPREVFDPEKLAELVESLRQHGVLQPLIVRRLSEDRYELVAGERRLRAAREAGMDRVPVVLRSYDDRTSLEVALIENLQRDDISAAESARAYCRLAEEFGMTQEQIAARVGKARSTVANVMRLLKLPEPVLDSLRNGEISEGHARALLQARPEAVLTAWQEVVRKRLNVHQTEHLARTLQPETRPKARRPSPISEVRDPNTAAIEEALETSLGTRVRVRHTGQKTGRVEIEFYSESELEGIVERILGSTA